MIARVSRGWATSSANADACEQVVAPEARRASPFEDRVRHYDVPSS